MFAGLDVLDGIIGWPCSKFGGYVGIRIEVDGLQAWWGGWMHGLGFLGGVSLGLLENTSAQVLKGVLTLCWVPFIATIRWMPPKPVWAHCCSRNRRAWLWSSCWATMVSLTRVAKLGKVKSGGVRAHCAWLVCRRKRGGEGLVG